MLAPGYSYNIRIAVDLVGLIVTPTGFPFLGFTLSAVLQTLIPSIVVVTVKENYTHFLEKIIQVILVLLAISACGYVFSLDQ